MRYAYPPYVNYAQWKQLQMGKMRENRLRIRALMHKIVQTSDAKGGNMGGRMKGTHCVTHRAVCAKRAPAIKTDRYSS